MREEGVKTTSHFGRNSIKKKKKEKKQFNTKYDHTRICMENVKMYLPYINKSKYTKYIYIYVIYNI